MGIPVMRSLKDTFLLLALTKQERLLFTGYLKETDLTAFTGTGTDWRKRCLKTA